VGAQRNALPGQTLRNDGEAVSLELPKDHAILLWSEHGVEGVFDNTASLANRLRDIREFAAYRTAQFSVQIMRVNQ